MTHINKAKYLLLVAALGSQGLSAQEKDKVSQGDSVVLSGCADYVSPQHVIVDLSNPAKIGIKADVTQNFVKTEQGDIRFIQETQNALTFRFIGGVGGVKVKEDRRNSAFKEQIDSIVTTLLRQAQPLIGENGGSVSPPDACASYVPKYKRSYITLNVYTTEAWSKDKETATPSLSLKTVAGPKESWYLTGDVPINNIKQLQKDNGAVTLKEKPASFFMGINYRFGDYLSGTGPMGEAKSWQDNLSAKLLLKASSKPTESMGLGLGYKLPFGEVFVARMRSINKDEDGTALGGNTYGWVMGVSFDLASNLPSWIK